MIMQNLLYDFANCVSFGISLLSIYALLDYYVYSSTYLITLTVNMVIFQCAYDVFLWHTNSSVLHHICLLFLGSFLYQNQIEYDNCLFLIVPLLSTEISTLFLSIRHWLEQFQMTNTVWYSINNGFFVTTFLITRIYIFSNYIIYNPDTYAFAELVTNHEITACFSFYIGIYGLFALNIYWVTIIVKVLLKSFRESLDDYYQEHLIYIGPMVNAFFMMYIYDEVNAHVVGTMLMAISASTLYYFVFYEPQSPYITILYLLNQLLFQLLSILSVYTIHGGFIGTLSLIYHIYYITLSMYMINCDLMTISITGKSVLDGILFPALIYNYFWEEVVSMPLILLVICLMITRYSSVLFTIKQSDVLLLPVLADVVMLILVSTSADVNTRINLALVAYCMVLLIYIQPFYNQNRVLLHLLSFLYGIILVQL